MIPGIPHECCANCQFARPFVDKIGAYNPGRSSIYKYHKTAFIFLRRVDCIPPFANLPSPQFPHARATINDPIKFTCLSFIERLNNDVSTTRRYIKKLR